MENLTRKAQLQEIELERTTKQLKEAIAIAEEETVKCKAAKEVIKSLTAQVSFFSDWMVSWLTTADRQSILYIRSNFIKEAYQMIEWSYFNTILI